MESNNTLNTIKLFFSNYKIDGVCEFMIDEEKDETGVYWVYIVLDLDWIKQLQTKPEFVAARMRREVAREFFRYTGIRIDVGSYAEKCNK